MNKDELQESKALIKLKCIKNIIDILHNLNMIDNDVDAKQYNIYLDYIKESDFTTFKVEIQSEGYNKNNPLFKFNFKLKDESTGFAIFKLIREYFVKKNDLQYSGFQYDRKDETLSYSSQQVITNHRVNLYSKIHSDKDLKKLEKFNQKIYEQYETFFRNTRTNTFNKDKIQQLKAEEKGNIVISVISMLNELLNIDSYKEQYYDITMDYIKIDNYYRFDVKILKNNQQKPFSINFKLKDKEKGLEIFDKIIESYIDNTLVVYDGYNQSVSPNKINYIIKSKNKINIIYKMSTFDSETIIPKIKKEIEQNENVKTLKKSNN